MTSAAGMNVKCVECMLVNLSNTSCDLVYNVSNTSCDLVYNVSNISCDLVYNLSNAHMLPLGDIAYSVYLMGVADHS